MRLLVAQAAARPRGAWVLWRGGGGSGDLLFLPRGGPCYWSHSPRGSIRMPQNRGAWHGGPGVRHRLFRRHIHNVVEDIRREMPLREARHFIALGGDARFAAARLGPEEVPAGTVRSVTKDAFLAFCEEMAALDEEALVERYRLPMVEAETLLPALLAYRELLLETQAEAVLVPDASLRAGMLLDMARSEQGLGLEDLSRVVLLSAAALGEKYRYDAKHAKNVAHLSARLFDELRSE